MASNKTTNAHALSLQELRSMEPERVLWQTYLYENGSTDTDVCFWTGFGVFNDKIDGQEETIQYINGFDHVDGYGVYFVFWSDRPSEEQVKEYVWKTNT